MKKQFRILLFFYHLLSASIIAYGQDTIPLQHEERTIFPIQKLKICDTGKLDSTHQNCQTEIQDGWVNTQTLALNESTWIQASIIFLEDHQTNLALMGRNFRGAHEVYWNGELIAQNGVIGSNYSKSKIGRYQFYALIPPHFLHAGKHHLAIKHLKMGQAQNIGARLWIGSFVDFKKQDTNTNNQMILMLTVFLTSALFFLIFYFGFGRKISFLFLSFYCISYVIKSLLKPYQDFFTPDFLIPYMSFESSHLPANIGSIFLIAFLLWEMLVPKKGLFLAAFAVLSIWGYFGLTEVQYLTTLMIAATAIVTYGVYKKIDGIGWALIGLGGFITLLILWMQGVLGYGYFAGVIFFLVCMTFSVGQRIARQIQLKQAALLRSSTLENQLLKKSIQPHFILNSLASLQELIDQNPEKASDFVEQLAEEFKLVSRVSDQKLIPIEDELNMCRIHLKIMEYRKNASFEFKTEGLSGDEKVPPGIFHTLIENGITHGYGTKREGLFVLSKSANNGHIEYRFFNDGEFEIPENGEADQGTGLKYIEARLKETYDNNWKLKSGKVSGGWKVIISIKN